jgi:hypothetical protein
MTLGELKLNIAGIHKLQSLEKLPLDTKRKVYKLSKWLDCVAEEVEAMDGDMKDDADLDKCEVVFTEDELMQIDISIAQIQNLDNLGLVK